MGGTMQHCTWRRGEGLGSVNSQELVRSDYVKVRSEVKESGCLEPNSGKLGTK